MAQPTTPSNTSTSNTTAVANSGNSLTLELPTDLLTGAGSGLSLNYNLGGNGSAIANSAYNFLNGVNNTDQAFVGGAIVQTQGAIAGAISPLLNVATELGGTFNNLMPHIVNDVFAAANNANQTSIQISANSTAASEAASQASIAESNNANSGGGCFITTAVCGTLNLPDDCFILIKLRAFRDGYMLDDGERAMLVKRYYKVAPGYVEAINQRDDAPRIYAKMYTHFIRPAVDAIDSGDDEEAFALYRALVEYAKVKAHASGTR